MNKGVVLAGGLGTRLLPLTLVTNKHHLPVFNKPMCYYPLNTLIQSGIDDIMIITGKEHCGSFIELLGSEFNGAALTYKVQNKPSGIADALRSAKRFVSEENFVTILSDNIFEDKFDFSNFREGSRVFLKRVSDPQRYGVARLRTSIKSIYKEREDRLIEIIEKPKIDTTDNELIDKNGYGFAVTGIYLYSHDVFDKISCLKPSTRNELEVTDLNNMYIREGKMDFEIINGFWSDAGTFSSLFNASEFVRSKELNL